MVRASLIIISIKNQRLSIAICRFHILVSDFAVRIHAQDHFAYRPFAVISKLYFYYMSSVGKIRFPFNFLPASLATP